VKGLIPTQYRSYLGYVKILKRILYPYSLTVFYLPNDNEVEHLLKPLSVLSNATAPRVLKKRNQGKYRFL
jgi:hypothetical protein